MKYAWKSSIRNYRVTLSAIAAIAALAFFLSAFTGGIQKNREQLERVYEVTTVTAAVTGYQDAPTASLSEKQYQAIMNSGFVKTSTALIQKKLFGSGYVRGIDKIAADPNLEGWLPYMDWLEGYDDSLFSNKEAVCIAPRLEGLQPGTTLTLKLAKDVEMPILVVGLYGSPYGVSPSEAIYYCSLDFLKDQLVNMGETPVYNKLEMELCRLERLNTFKTQMKELGLDKGSAQLVINDALLQELSGRFRQQIRLMNLLLPILLAIVSGIGFGLSFLLLQGRKREAAVMRSLGMHYRTVFCVFLAETALQASAGTLIGGFVAMIVLGSTAFRLQYLLLVLACYLLGGGAAVHKIAKANVFTVMTGE